MPLVQEKKRKIDFQDGHQGGHLGFPTKKIKVIFDLQVTIMLPSKFQVSWPFGSGEEAKNRFKDGGHRSHFGFIIGTILPTFDLQVTPILPTKFQVNWPFGSGEEATNRFLKMAAILDSNPFNLSYFWSTSHPYASYQVSSQLAFQLRRRSEK